MHLRLLAFLAAISVALAGCTGIDPGGMFKSPLATKPGVVDSREAASLISQYRRQHGLGGVSVDPALTRIAATHSQRMAAANKMAHVLPGEGSFRQRLSAGGFHGGTAAENVAAGQKNLATVLDSWRRSPGHNKNLLLPGVTHIGIAVAVAPESRYKNFWTLVLGSPGEPRVVSLPDAGPAVIAVGGGIVGAN